MPQDTSTHKYTNLKYANLNRLLEIKQLHQFSVVVETGVMSRASELLNISQPALTQIIKNIENTVGALVLTRKPRGVEPTPEGQYLYNYANKVLNETYKAMHEIKRISAGELGQVHIGIASFLSEDFAPKIVLELKKTYPELTITITEGKLYDLVQGLSERHLDIAFSNYSVFSNWVDCRFEPLTTTRTNFLIGNSHPLFKVKKVEKEQIGKCSLALPRMPHEGDPFYEMYSKIGFDVSHALVTNSIPLLRSLLFSGEFVIILPEHLFVEELKDGRVKSLDFPGMPISLEFGIITTKDEEQKNTVNIVRDVAKQVSEATFHLNKPK